LNDRASEPEREKALTLWFNSTLALLLLLGQREETEGSYMQFKKPTLLGLPVLDVRTLSQQQIVGLSSAYDRLSSRTLMPFSRIASDPTRAAIDQEISTILGLPALERLRELLQAEPIVAGNSDGLR